MIKNWWRRFWAWLKSFFRKKHIAIKPTGSVSMLAGNNQGIEPRDGMFIRHHKDGSTSSGHITEHNDWLTGGFMGGFENKYPSSFIKKLGKMLGMKVVELGPPPIVANKDIDVKPMGKPLDRLFYANPVFYPNQINEEDLNKKHEPSPSSKRLIAKILEASEKIEKAQKSGSVMNFIVTPQLLKHVMRVYDCTENEATVIIRQIFGGQNIVINIGTNKEPR